MANDQASRVREASEEDYVLDEQVGYMLRRAYHRNTLIFQELVPEGLTPTQFAAMYRLSRDGPLSQNQLGRSASMDAATIKGVVHRLAGRGLLRTTPDPKDARRILISLTPDGDHMLTQAVDRAKEVSRTTLSPLKPVERRTFLKLLRRIQ